MTKMSATDKIRFTSDDLDLFSSASGDRNPLHCSAEYARRTAYGKPVVFGVLAGLYTLSRLNQQQTRRVQQIILGFAGAMFTDIDYTLHVTHDDADSAILELRDGSRVMLTVDVVFEQCEAAATFDPGHSLFPCCEPADRTFCDLTTDLSLTGAYRPALDDLRLLIDRLDLSDIGIDEVQLGTLLWASYIVGMELPGERALFGRLAIDFGARSLRSAGPLEYTAEVVAVDERFEMLRYRAAILTNSTHWADVEVWSFVRRDLPEVDNIQLRHVLGESETLEGKVALITGASRGLGAAITRAMVLQGCTVHANYRDCHTEAKQLQTRLEGAPGKVVLAQGDATDPRWARDASRKIDATGKGIDFLICNACPATIPMSIDLDSIERFNEYVSQSVSMVSTALAAFLDMLAGNSGLVVIISSSYVDDVPLHLPHYVCAKNAIEGLAKAAAIEYPNVAFLIVRPPRLLTDLTNVPMGHADAIAPERVAADLVRRLAERPPAGDVHYLVCFDPRLEPVT